MLSDRQNVLTSVLGYHPFDLFDFDTIHYEPFEIKPRKKGRSSRTILAPCESLKAIQTALLERILVHVPPHPAATAFFKGRSTCLNAKQHHKCRYLYKTDVKDFFASIKADRVMCVLERHFPHLSTLGKTEIVRITTFQGSLPQGAPTSPHLANLALYEFDEFVSRHCDRLGACYTRYADDIAVSADSEDVLKTVAKVVGSRLAELDLLLHPEKTRFFGPNVRKIITGLDVTSEIIRPPRHIRKKAAAMLRICEVYPSRLKRKLERIKGYLAYWQGTSPDDPELRRLKERLGKLHGKKEDHDCAVETRRSLPNPSDSENPF